MRNTLSEDEKYMLDQLESGLRSKYGELSKDKKSKIDAFEAALNLIPTAAGRKYAISKFLNTDDDFANQDDFPKLNKELWSVKNQEDYTPPDVEKYEAKKDAEEFWNWDSNKHWTKRNTNELKRRATDAGYTDFGAYMNDVRDVQTQKMREKNLEDEFGKVGSFAVKTLYPRMTEKVLQGKDIDRVKDLGLDMGEQLLYAFNPAERLLGTSTKLMTKAPTLAKWGGAVANPLAMETADAIAYNGEDTDRANFSPIDVGVGTLINKGLGKLSTDKLNVRHRAKLPKEYETAASVAKREKFAEDWGKKNEFIDNLMKEQELEAAKSHSKEAESLNYATLEKLMELVKFGTGPEKEMAKTTLKEYARNEAKNLLPNATDFTINKFGDVVSEDPNRTKKVAKRAFGPAGFFISPQINDMVDAYYGSDKKNKEKDKIDYLIDGLQGGR